MSDCVASIEEYFDQRQGGESGSGNNAFPFIRASELTAKPVMIDWLLENIVERGSLNLLFGEPGAGKSLFALDWAFCIASGLDWHGHRTMPVDVVVIAGEGHAGMARRFKALEVKYRTAAPSGLFISQRPAQLLDANNARWVAETVKTLCQNPGLIVIDTLHRNMEGDENSSQDIARFVGNLDTYFKPLGVAILVVHHSGHGQKDRSRGSSSIRAAMDGEFSATKDDAGITLSCHKAKDFEGFKPMRFSLKHIELDWLDESDNAMTSVFLEYDGEARPITARRKLSARDDAILYALTEAVDKHGIEPPGEIREKFAGFKGWGNAAHKVVHIDHWRERAYKAITVDEGGEAAMPAKKMAFKRCRDRLLNQGFTVEHGGYCWRIS